jgi:magnesium transporter
MENIERVEDDIFDPKKRETVHELSVLRRDIISYRRIVWPLRAVVGALEHRTERFTKEDLKVYWGDMVDHMDKIWDSLDECKEIIEGLNDTSNSLFSHHTNEVMRILTIMATIMLPLSVIASIYGMNVALPGGLNQGSPSSFIILLVIMLGVISGMLLFFRSHHWI